MTKKKKASVEITDGQELKAIVPESSVFGEMELCMEPRDPGYDERGHGLLPDQEPVLIIKGEKQLLAKCGQPDLTHPYFPFRNPEGYCEDAFKTIDEWWKYERGDLTVYMTRGSVLITDSRNIQRVYNGDKRVLVVSCSYIKAPTLSVGDNVHVHGSKLVSETSMTLVENRISNTFIGTKGRLGLHNVEAYESHIRVESCNLRDTSLGKARIHGGKSQFFSAFAGVFETTLGVANAKKIAINTHVRKLDFNNYNLNTEIRLDHRTHYGSFGGTAASFVQTQDGIAFNNFEINCGEWLGSEIVTDGDLGVRPWTPFQPSVNVVQVPTNTKLFFQLLAVATGNPGMNVQIFDSKITKPNALQRELVEQISTQITSRMQLWQTIAMLKETTHRPELNDLIGDYY